MSAAISWWAFVLRYEARELWRALPGPWWAKIILIAVLQLIPGMLDEIALLAILALLRRRRARVSGQAREVAAGAVT